MKTKLKVHRNHVRQTILKMKKQHKEGSLQNALQILNEAAQGKREELYHAMENHYGDIREAFQDIFVNAAATGRIALTRTAQNAGKAIAEGEQQLEKRIKTTAAAVDKKVHENPWLAISSLSLGAFLLGYKFHQPQNRKPAAEKIKKLTVQKKPRQKRAAAGKKTRK